MGRFCVLDSCLKTRVCARFLIKLNFAVKKLAAIRGQIMGDKHDRFIRLEQAGNNLPRGGLVNGTGSFIDQKQLAVVKIAAGQNDFLPLTARDIAVFYGNPCIKPSRPQAQVLT